MGATLLIYLLRCAVRRLVTVGRVVVGDVGEAPNFCIPQSLLFCLGLSVCYPAGQGSGGRVSRAPPPPHL